MEPVPPTPDDDAPRAGASCPACRAATAGDQRYCLSCGALVGDRRLDPIEMLSPAAGADPVGGPPTGPTAGAPRAVPLAAATAAIVVAGISGMLVTQGGSGTGARAAVIAAAPAPAPTAAGADRTDPAPAPPADVSAPLPADDPLPADPLPADEPLPADSEAPADDPADDATDGDASGDDSADEPAPETTPRVWLLALEGPQAAEAVERVAKRGVRLSGMRNVAATAQPNATALVGGTRPVDPAAAPADPGAAGPGAAAGGAGSNGGAGTGRGAGTGTAPSLPAALTAAKRSWRAYVDVQPTSGSVLPGACAAAPAGDATAALLASRLPFAAIEGIGCDKAVTSLEALGNDLSAGEDIPAFSYVAMGGCAAPERPVVALPDAVEDAVTTITESTEYQQDGMLVVTTVGTQDACTPAVPGSASSTVAAAGAPAAVAPATPGDSATPGNSATPGDPAAPVAPVDPTGAAAPAVTEAPTVVLRPAATAGKTVQAKLDLLALSRSMADVLGVTPPGAAGDDAVPAIALPGVPKPAAANR